MDNLDNKKFGLLISELRKEKHLTQKELGDKLYVTDKTISKWERGISMPSIALLIPISNLFNISVTELLQGERLDDFDKVEKIESEFIRSFNENRIKWKYIYCVCCLVSTTCLFLLFQFGLSFNKMKDNVILIVGLMLLFGGWFCFFAKDLLPGYYDKYKIYHISQGIFHMNFIGLSFNNNNWPEICKASRISTLSIAVIYPILTLIIVNWHGLKQWNEIQTILVFASICIMFLSIYWTGKKYE